MLGRALCVPIKSEFMGIGLSRLAILIALESTSSINQLLDGFEVRIVRHVKSPSSKGEIWKSYRARRNNEAAINMFWITKRSKKKYLLTTRWWWNSTAHVLALQDDPHPKSIPRVWLDRIGLAFDRETFSNFRLFSFLTEICTTKIRQLDPRQGKSPTFSPLARSRRLRCEYERT